MGGILGKRNHKLHTGFFLFQIKKGTSRLTNMAILRKKGTLGSQWQSLINSPFVHIENNEKVNLMHQLVSFQQQIADNNEGLITLIGHLLDCPIFVKTFILQILFVEVVFIIIQGCCYF